MKTTSPATAITVPEKSPEIIISLLAGYGCLRLEERCGIPSAPCPHQLCKRLHAQSKAQKPKHLCLWCIGGCLRLLRERHSFCTLAFLLHLALIAIISIPLLHLQKVPCGLMYGLIFLTCTSAHRAEPCRGPCEVQCSPLDWFNVSTHTVRMSLEMNTGGGKNFPDHPLRQSPGAHKRYD